MASMASEQIRQAERDGEGGPTPSAIDDLEKGPNSPVTAGELQILLDVDTETSVVDQSAVLEQTGMAGAVGDVYQAVASLVLRSPTPAERMPPPKTTMKSLAQPAYALPELNEEQQAELERVSVRVGNDSKAVYIERYLLECEQDGGPLPLDPFIVNAIKKECTPTLLTLLKGRSEWLETYRGWHEGMQTSIEFHWASWRAGEAERLIRLAEEEKANEQLKLDLTGEDMDVTETDNTAPKLSLLSTEEFAAKSVDIRQTNSAEEDARIERERVRLADEGLLDASAESLVEMKKEVEANKKKQKALNNKIREMQRTKRALDKEQKDKEKKDEPKSTSRKLEQSKVVESDIDDEGFSLPRQSTRNRKKKGKKKTEVVEPGETTDDDSVKAAAELLLNLDPVENKEDGEVDSDASDTPSCQSEKVIWENARGGFQSFIPNCMEETKKNRSFYACPESINRDGESDDEEWLKPTRKDPSESRHINVMLGRLSSSWSAAYYTKEHRAKLTYAARKYDEKDRRACPFEICVNASMDPKEYSSKMRFHRHLMEVHMHHHPTYVCARDTGKVNEKCIGLVTSRRTDLLRHLRKVHAKSMVDAASITNRLHAALMRSQNIDSAEAREVTSLTKIWGQVILTKSGKQTARFSLSHVPGRLHLSDELHGEALRMAGLAPPKRLSTDVVDVIPLKKPRNGAASAKPKGYQGVGYRGVAYSTFGRDPSPLGSKDRGQAPDFSWSSRPDQRPKPKPAVASSAGLEGQEEEQFPVLGPSGKETQTLTQTGKDRDAKKKETPVEGAMAMPTGAIRNEVIRFPDYFDGVEKPSCDIQKAVFDKWQCKQRELFVDLSQNMAALTLHTVTEIQLRENLRINEQADTRVQDEIVAARLSKKLCAENVTYVKDQMRELTLEMEEML